MPGASFKRWAREAREKLTEMTKAPYEMVKQRVADGTATVSFTSKNIFDENGNPVSAADEDIAIWAAAGLYVGGADTVVAGLSNFMLSVTLFPAAQKRAQEELDSVIGSQRLPTLADRERLPYLDALFKETLRWNPIGPMALAHELQADDEYEGYHLPRGSIVYSNIWAMTRDETVYPDPESFTPERFMKETPHKDPRELIFGIGRRRCPGRYLAEANLWIVFAKILATMNISPAGEVPVPQFTSGPNWLVHWLLVPPCS